MPWLHTVAFSVQAGRLAFSSHPDQFQDMSPVLHKSALTKLCSSWPLGPAWTPGPIPSGAQAAAFPIGAEDYWNFIAYVHKTLRNSVSCELYLPVKLGLNQTATAIAVYRLDLKPTY